MRDATRCDANDAMRTNRPTELMHVRRKGCLCSSQGISQAGRQGRIEVLEQWFDESAFPSTAPPMGLVRKRHGNRCYASAVPLAAAGSMHNILVYIDKHVPLLFASPASSRPPLRVPLFASPLRASPLSHGNNGTHPRHHHHQAHKTRKARKARKARTARTARKIHKTHKTSSTGSSRRPETGDPRDLP